MSQIPRIVAVIRDEATQSFSVEIEFRDVYRVIRSICVPRALVDDPRKLMIELKNAGANIRDIANTKKVFIQLKESEQKAKRIVLAKSLGWRKDGTFVSLTSTIGRKGRPEEVIRRPRSQLYQKARKRGSLRAWKRTVATPALYSSPLVFCLSATFAATTLRMSDLNSFGIMLVAPTKSGKSTIQLAAGSVIGFRKESHLPNFQCSDPALQELITAFSDHPVIVNEGELLAGDSKWRASRLNSLAYQLAEGRSKSFSKTISRPQTWYRTIFMGSLENSFRTDLERLQTIGASGSTARLIELPAASNKDPDIFDRAPSSLNDQRAAWVEAQFEMIRQGCKRNAGVALPEFVEYIIRNPITARRFLAKQSANFLKTIRTQADEPAVRHIAKYFAHIAAAGLLAQKLGIVPWSRAIVIDACRRCYDRAIKVLPTEENVLRRALAQLHNEINSGNLPKYRGTPLPETRLRDAGGYWESGREHRKYTIRADRFIGWVGSNAGLKLLQRFEKAGLLVAAKKRNISIKSRVIDFETQITWPDCKRVRSIQLIWDYRAMKAAIRAHS